MSKLLVSVDHTIFLAEQKCFQCSLKRCYRAGRFHTFCRVDITHHMDGTQKKIRRLSVLYERL